MAPVFFRLCFIGGICDWQKQNHIHPTPVGETMEANEQESSAPCSVSWTLQKAWAPTCAISLHACFFLLPLCSPAPSAPFYRASKSCAKMALPAPKFLMSSLCGRLDQYPKSKFPPNLIGAACIRCLPLVQSSVAWRVGLCGIVETGMWLEPE